MDNFIEQLSSLKEYITPAVILLASILAGFLLQYLTNRKLTIMAEKTKWRGDDIIIKGLKGKIILWSVLIGIYSALPMLKLPETYYNLGQKAVLVLAILSITLAASSVIVGFLRYYASQQKTELFATSIVSIITKTVVVSIGILIILQTLNISITPVLTALGVGGLAVALALQDTLSNLFSGIQILATRRVRKGDWIQLDAGEIGRVIDITWRNTTIQQRRNNIIIIPNNRVGSSIMINYNLPQQEMHFRIEIGVSYDSDLEHVEKVTVEVAEQITRDVDGADKSHKPFIRYHTFGDSSINFYVNLRLHGYNDMYRVRHAFIKALHKRYKEEGIVIPFPIRTLDIPPDFRLPGNSEKTN